MLLFNQSSGLLLCLCYQGSKKQRHFLDLTTGNWNKLIMLTITGMHGCQKNFQLKNHFRLPVDILLELTWQKKLNKCKQIKYVPGISDDSIKWIHQVYIIILLLSQFAPNKSTANHSPGGSIINWLLAY